MSDISSYPTATPTGDDLILGSQKDDSNIFHSFLPNQADINLLETTDNLKHIDDWCNANKITINIKKTNFMIIKPKRKECRIAGAVKIKNELLNEVHVSLFVGIYIDRYLVWDEHINNLCSVIRRKVGILYRLRHFIPKKVLVLLYYSFIQSHLSYGLEV